MGRTAAELIRERWTQEFLAEGPDGPAMRLNLTKPRAFLKVDEGEVSDLTGVDVLRPWRRGDPRFPIGSGAALGYVERPVIDAQGNQFRGLGASVFQAHYEGTESSFVATGTEVRIGTRLYPHLFGGKGWPTTMLAAAFTWMDFSSVPAWKAESTYVSGFKSQSNANDVLMLSPGLVVVPGERDVFRVESVLDKDYRGILVSNGRRIHLFQGAAYSATPFLDMQTTRYGDRWRGVRISNARMMFVSDRHPPKVVHLSGQRTIPAHLGFTGGSWTPASRTINTAAQFTNYFYRSGDKFIIVSGTGVYPGTYEIESKTDNSNIVLKTSAGATAAFGDVIGYIVRGAEHDTLSISGPMPVFNRRKPQTGPSSDGPLMHVSGGGSITAGKCAVRLRLIDLESNAVSPFYQCGVQGDPTSTTLTVTAGVGVGIAGIIPESLHRRGHLLQIWRKLSGGSDYFLEMEVPTEYLFVGSEPVLLLSDSDLAQRQILLAAEVNRGVPPAGRDVAVLGDTGIVLIAGKTDKSNFSNPVIGGYEYLWPTVDNDNVIHFSRTDAFDPENFPPSVSNQIVLSAIGDRFQRFAVSGEDVLAIMEHGVYAFSSGGPLGVQRRVIAERGLGTPWPESVISAERFAAWVTTENVYIYNASADEESQVRLQTVGDEIRDWLLEAHRFGDEIRSAYDSRRGVLIVRRLHADGTYTDWERHLRSRQSVMMLDRPGVRVVESTYANTSPSSLPLPYSVDVSGAVMEIGRRQIAGDSHPFDGATVQATIDGTYTITSDTISKAAAFKTSMLGEVVRIRSSNAGRDGQRRVITAFQNSGSSVNFSNDSGPVGTIAFEMLTNDLGVMAYKNNASKIHVVPVRLSADGVISFGTPLIFASAGGGSPSLSAESPTRVWFSVQVGVEVNVFMLTVNKDFLSASAGLIVPSAASTSSRCCVTFVSDRKAVVSYRDDSTNRLRLVAVFANRDGTLSNGQHLDMAGTAVSSKSVVVRLADDALFVAWDEAASGKIAYVTLTGSALAHVVTNTFQATAISDLAVATLGTAAAVLSYSITAGATGQLNVASYAAGAITFGTAQQFLGTANNNHDIAMLSSNQGVLVFRRSSDGAGLAQPFTASAAAGVFVDAAFAIVFQAQSSLHAVARSDNTHFVIGLQNTAAAAVVTAKAGLLYPSGTASVGLVNTGPPDAIGFDSILSGLANGDEFIIGAVPFKVRFAPVTGDRMRNTKQIDGLSVWAAPNGRTVTTTKKMRAKVYRNLSLTPAVLNAAAATSVDLPIRSPDEAAATDEAMYADLFVDGKTIEVELSNEDADTGFILNNVAAVMTQCGDLTGDRSTSS